MSGGSDERSRTLMREAMRSLRASEARIAELEAELQRERATGRSAEGAPDSVSIAGAACRLPGGIDSPEAFAEALAAARDLVSDDPGERFDARRFLHADPDHPGSMVSAAAAWLSDVEGFEPEAFGVAPREVALLDPQHRLLLELAVHAAEDAGVPLQRLAGPKTGVFIGISAQDHALHLAEHLPREAVEPASGIGSAHAAAAGRIAFHFGLEGPCFTVDTACSSGLVALDQALAALRSGRCDHAFVGGVNIMLSPQMSIVFSQARMLSASGRCRSFSDAADGYVRGEGAIMLLLRAERSSPQGKGVHRARARVLGSASNQDGASSGLTVPRRGAQRACIASALKDAACAPERVDAIEAHGTGTALGDPIELGALHDVFGEGRTRPLAVSSVKSNLGHLEAAAGLVGVLKACLQLEEGRLYPHLHGERPTTHFDWKLSPLAMPEQLVEPMAPRIIGVSSFGFTGSNAHVVLGRAEGASEELSLRSSAAASVADWPLLLSARTLDGLRTQATTWAPRLGEPLRDEERAGLVAESWWGRDRYREGVALDPRVPERWRSALEALAGGGVEAFTASAAGWAGRRPARAHSRARWLLEDGWELRGSRESMAELIACGFAPSEFVLAFGVAPAETAALSEWLGHQGVEASFVQAEFGSELESESAAHAQPRVTVRWSQCDREVEEQSGKASSLDGGWPLPELLAKLALAGVVPLAKPGQERLRAVRAPLRGFARRAFRVERHPAAFGVSSSDPGDAHPLLGRAVRDGEGGWCFRVQLRPDAPAWLAEGRAGAEAGPAVALSALLAVAARTTSGAPFALEDLRLAAPRPVRETVLLESRLTWSPDAGWTLRAELCSGSRARYGLGQARLVPSGSSQPSGDEESALEEERQPLPLASRWLQDARAYGVHPTQWQALLSLPQGGRIQRLSALALSREATPELFMGSTPSVHWLESRDGRRILEWTAAEPVGQTPAALSGRVFIAQARRLGRPLPRPSSEAPVRVLMPSGCAAYPCGVALPAEAPTLLCPVELPTKAVPETPVLLKAMAHLVRRHRQERAGAGLHLVLPNALGGPAIQALRAAWRVVAAEHPRETGRCFSGELGPVASWGQVLAQLEGPSVRAEQEQELHLSRSVGGALEVCTPRLMPLAWTDGEREAAEFHGLHLVTGAMGALGQRLARQLAVRPELSLVLWSRSMDSEGGRALVEELRAQGARVVGEAVDLRDPSAVLAGLERLVEDASLPDLNTVHHLAASLADVRVVAASAADFERAWSAKVEGARHLDSALRSLFEARAAGVESSELSGVPRLITFGSAAEWLGAPGQVAYAAANAALSSVAQRRAQRCGAAAALHVSFGPFGEAGMGVQSGHVGTEGLEALSPEALARMLEELVESGRAEVVVADWDPARIWAAGGRRAPARFESLLPPGYGGDVEAEGEGRDWLALPPQERTAAVAGWLEAALSHLLGNAGASLAQDRPLIELGCDSLTLLHLSHALEAEFDQAHAVESLLAAPHLSALKAQILSGLADGDRVAQGMGDFGTASGVDPVQLDAEAEALLAELEGDESNPKGHDEDSRA